MDMPARQPSKQTLAAAKWLTWEGPSKKERQNATMEIIMAHLGYLLRLS
jgi:hypothetical protein